MVVWSIYIFFMQNSIQVSICKMYHTLYWHIIQPIADKKWFLFYLFINLFVNFHKSKINKKAGNASK